MPQIRTQIKRFPTDGRCGVFAWVFLLGTAPDFRQKPFLTPVGAVS